MTGIYNPFAKQVWELAHGVTVTLGPDAIIMGILNVTPDSFSDGGQFFSPQAAIDQARRMRDEGAQIIDIGGESSRPGFEPVSAAEEQARVMPVIDALVREGGYILSIDSWRAETARRAIEAGAHIVNDVWGLQKDDALAPFIARSRSGCIVMHTGRERQKARDIIEDQRQFLSRSLEVAHEAGVSREAMVLDPGFGFAKNGEEDTALLARLEEVVVLGYPIMTGTSRKRFIGQITGRDGNARDVGTAATSVVARLKGSALFRVHDVQANKDALAIADAVLKAGDMK
ncbi:MAG: dihydropteroate synthase [Rhizobiaceae bacterium]